MSVQLHLGECLTVLRTMPDASVDAVVTDPPYGLSFMGKRWDYDVPSVEVWAECLRVLKPGGHLLAFAGTRTQHRMAVRIEDAGFEIRDMIAWVYGSGFPKSLNVAKQIDRKDGRLGWESPNSGKYGGDGNGMCRPGTKRMPNIDVELETDAARQWQGWGTALKPALEPITVARKPLAGTVAENVLAHGTGALNVDGCRVGRDTNDVSGWSQSGSKASENRAMSGANYAREAKPDADGRWPANLIHDGSDEPTGLLRDAARFFYCAKASKADRGDGNTHPTVKPTDLMRYLCRLVTPPGGVVLDPFMGSGSTGKAATMEGFRFIGIERDEGYFSIANARIKAAMSAGLGQIDIFDGKV